MGLTIGALHVRRSAFIKAPRERVWQEFESEERIRAWLDFGHHLHRFEPKVGGVVRMSVELDGVVQPFGGKVIVFDPARELSFESQWQNEKIAWPEPTFWTLRLRTLAGGTHVELYHHGFERFGDDAGSELEDYEWGWDVKHLAALRAIVEGS